MAAMKHKLTDRQLAALVAVYFGASANEEPMGIYSPDHPDSDKAGKPYWRRRTSMGGAVGRMMDGLREQGLLSDPNRYERLQGKPYADLYGQLTAKGYEALGERLDKLPTIKQLGEVIYRFTIDPAELEQRRAARADREAEMDRLRKEERDADRVVQAERRERANQKKLADLRKLFQAKGLADNWDDQQLLDFADSVASLA
jgi:hypothetical protein